MLENISVFYYILPFSRSNFVVTLLSNVRNQTKQCTFPVVCSADEEKNKAASSKSFSAQRLKKTLSLLACNVIIIMKLQQQNAYSYSKTLSLYALRKLFVHSFVKVKEYFCSANIFIQKYTI